MHTQPHRWPPFVADALLALAIVLVFLGVAQYKSWYPQALPWLKHDYRSHIGAEYNDIALAIRKGRGFSDPFRCETGPTAWMPPVLPYGMAGLYWLSQDRPDALIPWMVGLQGIGAWLAAFLALQEARRIHCTAAGVVIVCLVFAANFYQLFQQTHDTALLLVVISLLWFGLTRIGQDTGWLSRGAWGAWGGFCTLCSPVVGAVWWICTAWTFAPKRMAWAEFRGLAITMLVWLLVISPWMIRNYVQFHKWFPIKPNGMYELWQSHCNDDDGVLDEKSASGHPWSSNGEQRTRYQEIGEIAFIEEKGAEIRQAIYDQPMGYLDRVSNRAVAALVYYVPFSMVEEYNGGWPLVFTRLVHPLPLLAIFVTLAFGTFPIDRKFLMALAVFGWVLLPYVLVSYHDRYAATLAGMKMLLMLHGWATVKKKTGRGLSIRAFCAQKRISAPSFTLFRCTGDE